jgi:hypothetical protein
MELEGHCPDMSNPKKEGTTSKPTGRERLVASAALLLSVVFAIAVFFILDGLYTAWITRKQVSYNACKVRDPIRHHAFAANCAAVQHWGGDSYDFFTNNLGFRDERIRDVPAADARPRVLFLGDSYTEGTLAWSDSYVGRVAAHFPQFDFLNGGVGSYSPSNYLNTARMVLDKGIEFDEVIVFIDISNVQDEAAYYKDRDKSGSVIVDDKSQRWSMSWYAKVRSVISGHFLLTNYIFERVEQYLVGRGFYHLTRGWFGDTFDMERSAWTYRPVKEKDPYMIGFAPLGVEGGIAKEKAKMTLLWQELAKRNIPISVVVDPFPATLVHDTADSRQVRMWREWCDGKCQRFISVFPAFFAAKEQCPPNLPGCWYRNLFVFGDAHYNAGGNALVANAVIKSLTEVPPIKRSLRVSAVRDSGK